ncbi:MAG: FAD-dependent oxidoreductase [Planctomycetaceae bacterium]
METQCCIVGGGPAGVVLSYLLARRGVSVTLLEAHQDFDREFRGDTLHPSTLELMAQLGLADELLALPHTKARELTFRTPAGTFTPVNFGLLRSPYPFVTLMPQSQFLEFLSGHARQYEGFDIRMGANVRDLLQHEGVTCGVRYDGGNGEHEVRAPLVVACDGRFSRLRKAAGLEPIKTSPPMDVLWFRLSRRPGDLDVLNARIGGGHLVVILPRVDHFQLGYVIMKGSYHELRDSGLAALRTSLAELIPELADRVDELHDWKQIAPLSVESNRLPTWHQPGLLFLGDAAHVMSPVGGVGINLAIQDAVVAANVLTGPLLAGRVTAANLAAVQRRREWPTRVIQRFQSLVQKRVIQVALDPQVRFTVPLFFRLPWLRRLPARLIGIGLRRVRVE